MRGQLSRARRLDGLLGGPGAQDAASLYSRILANLQE